MSRHDGRPRVTRTLQENTCRKFPFFSSLPCLILRNVPFAVVIPLRVTPSVAFAVVFDGPRRPMRISILPLHLS